MRTKRQVDGYVAPPSTAGAVRGRPVKGSAAGRQIRLGGGCRWLWLGLLVGLSGCIGGSEPEAVNLLGKPGSRLAEFDRDSWINTIRSAVPGDLGETRYDLSLLSPRHFTVLVLDGEKLQDYFRSRGLDIDQKLLGDAATALSLKSLKSILVAFDDQLAAGLLGGGQPSRGWFVQMDFSAEVEPQTWNRWLLGIDPETAARTASGGWLSADKSYAVSWRSPAQVLISPEDELKRIAEATLEPGRSELMSDVLQNGGQSLLYFSLRAAPLQQLIEQVSQMATAFGGANAETQLLFDAVRSLDKVQLQADLMDESLLHLQLSFLDPSAAKTIQSLVNQNIDQFLAQGPGGGLPLPNAGNGGRGMTQELQKLWADIQTEMTQGGLSATAEGRTVHVRAARPQRLDEVVDQGLAGMAAAQAEVAKREKLRTLAVALQKFYRAHGRYPAESASPLLYRRIDQVTPEQATADQVVGEPAAAEATAGPPFSWRVALLPYLGYQELYAKFDFQQPWDSEVNRRAAASMPVVFDWNLQPAEGPQSLIRRGEALVPNSNFQCLVGTQGALGTAGVTTREQIADGPDRTLMLAHTPQMSTPWSAPAGWEVNSQQDLIRWLQSSNQPIPGLLFSGRAIMVNRDTQVETLLGFVTPAGKERFNRNSLSDITVFPPLDEE